MLDISLLTFNGTVSNGRTQGAASQSQGWYSAPGQTETKQIRRYTETQPQVVYIANKQSAGTLTIGGQSYSYGARSDTALSNTVLHELAHALGFGGHSTVTPSCVPPTGASNPPAASVSCRDKVHLSQSYLFGSSNGRRRLYLVFKI